MFTYVAAFAIAATLTITPLIVSRPATPQDNRKTKAAWVELNVARIMDINIVDTISLACQRPAYFLSKTEQTALKRALLSSVRIISPAI